MKLKPQKEKELYDKVMIALEKVKLQTFKTQRDMPAWRVRQMVLKEIEGFLYKGKKTDIWRRWNERNHNG